MSSTPVLPTAKPAEVGLSAQRLGRLLLVLQSEIDRRRLPGAVALIARHGKLALFENLGQQDPATSTSMAGDSIFRIYSMTQPIVLVAVMLLMEQGRLLLRHTAGLTYEFLDNAAVQRQYGQVNIGSRERSNAEFLQALAASPSHLRATQTVACSCA